MKRSIKAFLFAVLPIIAAVSAICYPIEAVADNEEVSSMVYFYEKSVTESFIKENVSQALVIPTYSSLAVANKDTIDKADDVDSDSSISAEEEHVVSNNKIITVWVMAAIAGLVALCAKRKKK